MTWGMVAVAGATVVGGVMSSKAAGKQSDAASAASAAELAFAQQQYDDWKEVYGPMESNLANYYTNLSPDMYEAQGLEAFNKEFDTSKARLQETLSQRGIVDSGLSLQLESQGNISAAEERARIRMSSDSAVAQEQTRFLQVGLGQDPSGDVANALGRASSNAAASADSANRAAGQAMSSAVQSVGRAGIALGDYYGGDK